MRKLLVLLLLCLSSLSYANRLNQNFMAWTDFAWQNFTKSGIDYTFNASLRFIDNTPTFNQGVFRAGMGYSFSNDLAAWMGYTFVPTQNVGTNFFTKEQRSWQQLSWNAITKKSVTVVSDTRLEQRYLSNSSGVGWRLRQRITFDFVPVLHFLPIAATPVIYDEVLLNLSHPQWVGSSTLGQNRFFIGFADRIKKIFVFQLGYLNQYVVASSAGTPNTDNHILSLSFVFDQ